MKDSESKARVIQSALCFASRAAGSDAFQVDVQPTTRDGSVTVVCFPDTEEQAMALLAFVKAFVWSEAELTKLPFAGWVVTVTVKEESK